MEANNYDIIWKDKLRNVLKEIIRICEENELRYFLTGGSCLGAIRHHDIIPWDDDIDIIMPRPDYEKFMLIAPKVVKPQFSIGHVTLKEDYAWPFVKVYDNTTTYIEMKTQFCVIGLNVDVFPLDGTSNNRFQDKIDFFVFRIIHHLYTPTPQRTIEQHNNIFIQLDVLLKKLFAPLRKTLYSLGEKWIKRYPYDKSNWLRMNYSAWGDKESGRKEVFDSYLLVPFGDIQARVPIGYDEYLKNLYGDYMTPPPENKRVTHHDQYYVNIERRLDEKEIDELKK